MNKSTLKKFTEELGKFVDDFTNRNPTDVNKIKIEGYINRKEEPTVKVTFQEVEITHDDITSGMNSIVQDMENTLRKHLSEQLGEERANEIINSAKEEAQQGADNVRKIIADKKESTRAQDFSIDPNNLESIKIPDDFTETEVDIVLDRIQKLKDDN